MTFLFRCAVFAIVCRFVCAVSLCLCQSQFCLGFSLNQFENYLNFGHSGCSFQLTRSLILPGRNCVIFRKVGLTKSIYLPLFWNKISGKRLPRNYGEDYLNRKQNRSAGITLVLAEQFYFSYSPKPTGNLRLEAPVEFPCV